MRELGLLLKYKLKMWSNIAKRRGRRGLPLWAYILILAGIFAAIGIPAYYMFVGIFQNYSQIIFGDVNLAGLFVEISMIGIFVLVLVTDTPAVALNIFMTDDVEFLLTLPISQQTIFASKTIETLFQGGFPALFVIPILASYATAIGMAWYAVCFMFVIYIFYFLMIAGISALLALVVSKFASRSGTQRFMIFTSLIVYVLAVLLMNMVGSLDSNAKDISQAFGSYVNTVNSPYLPSTWLLDAISGRWSGAVILIAVSIGIGILAYFIASNGILSGYSKMASASKKKRKYLKSYRIRTPMMAFISKDVKLMRREPSILFLLVYPAIFPLIFIFGGSKGIVPGILVSVFISSMYIVIATASLASMEIKTGDFIDTLPLEKRTPFWSKAIVVTTAFSIVILAVFLILSIFFGLISFAILAVILSIPIFLILTFFGVYATVKWPNSTGGVRRPLNTTGSLVSTGVGFLGSICPLAESFYISRLGNIPDIPSIFSFLIFLIAPLAIEITMGYMIFKMISKIDLSNLYGR